MRPGPGAVMATFAGANPPLVTPQFLMTYSSPPTATDYRSALNNVEGAATQVIFERTALGGDNNPTRLYLLNLNSGDAPTLLNNLDTSTRPDWSWYNNNQIAFSNNQGIWIQETTTSQPELLVATASMSYPAWGPSGPDDQWLVVDNHQSSEGLPTPRNTIITTGGQVITEITGPTNHWYGMPSVCMPNQYVWIAFAGQMVNGSGYDQEKNYIFVSRENDSGVWDCRPLDPNVDPLGPFQPAYQGRAPWYSPDGNWVAFESNRADKNGKLYAIYIQDAEGAFPAMQVTDIGWDAQHAKWYPDGKTLVASVRQEFGKWPARGIASLDVSAFVGSTQS
jgi:WD40 repeat protein